MCDPFTIGAAALMAAGTTAKFFGQRKADSAKERTYNAERKRQQGMEAEQVGRFKDSLDEAGKLTDPNEQRKATDIRDAVLQSAARPAGPGVGGYLPGSSSAPSVVATAGDKAAAASAAQTSSLARTLATLGGTTDALQGADIAIGRNGQDIAQLGSFKRGSLNVLDAEMAAAAAKGGNLRALGGLAQQIGGAMLTAGAFGGAGAGAASATEAGSAAGAGSVFTTASPSSGAIFGRLMPLVR